MVRVVVSWEGLVGAVEVDRVAKVFRVETMARGTVVVGSEAVRVVVPWGVSVGAVEVVWVGSVAVRVVVSWEVSEGAVEVGWVDREVGSRGWAMWALVVSLVGTQGRGALEDS